MVAKEDKYIPIVRWVGSKKRIINKIIENVPKEFNNYYGFCRRSNCIFTYAL